MRDRKQIEKDIRKYADRIAAALATGGNVSLSISRTGSLKAYREHAERIDLERNAGADPVRG